MELQIDRIRTTDTAEANLIVSCIRGPVCRGARFRQIPGAVEAIDVELIQIAICCRPVQELDPVHTALVTLPGTGTHHLMPGGSAVGWQIIEGTNPPL
ncbi:hypothetical protein [Streptomyces sp. NBC_00316]|uniref:hypothetical protein n=1 Tax=Streptomyces sp. NBC_00316 TaxID=2975710 RepID=UPI002E2C9D35|nr:hypothetical protein [Streptomyces sp. NBC_00316]